MKVGITIPKIKSLHTNGIVFNTLLWYDFFQNCGFDVSFITYDKDTVTHEDYKFLNFYNLWNYDDEKNISLVENYKEKYPELFDFDIVFNVGLFDAPFLTLLKLESVKLIYIMLGSVYHNDIHCIVDEKFSTSITTFLYDEISFET